MLAAHIIVKNWYLQIWSKQAKGRIGILLRNRINLFYESLKAGTSIQTSLQIINHPIQTALIINTGQIERKKYTSTLYCVKMQLEGINIPSNRLSYIERMLEKQLRCYIRVALERGIFILGGRIAEVMQMCKQITCIIRRNYSKTTPTPISTHSIITIKANQVKNRKKSAKRDIDCRLSEETSWNRLSKILWLEDIKYRGTFPSQEQIEPPSVVLATSVLFMYEELRGRKNFMYELFNKEFQRMLTLQIQFWSRLNPKEFAKESAEAYTQLAEINQVIQGVYQLIDWLLEFNRETGWLNLTQTSRPV